jgi:peptidoglycan/xylan/chitin deacetylase (PgdA/CDA1 family)
MYLSRTPHITRLIYPGLTWQLKDNGNNLYITFDDGPDPQVTPEVLERLEHFQAKATFFCVGEKVNRYPGLFNSLLENGHSIGNHTHNHLNGRKTGTDDYIKNVEKAAGLIPSGLFRPPYGRITKQQINRLAGAYKIIMWSVLPGDFDRKLSKEEVLKRAIRHTRKGSIIVFHDNAKFKDKMLFALDGFLRHFSTIGYNFRAIKEESIKSQRK